MSWTRKADYGTVGYALNRQLYGRFFSRKSHFRHARPSAIVSPRFVAAVITDDAVFKIIYGRFSTKNKTTTRTIVHR